MPVDDQLGDVCPGRHLVHGRVGVAAQLAFLPRIQRQVSTPRLIALGLVSVVLAFAVLIPPAVLSPGQRVSMAWLIVCMTLLVIGELLVAPLGLSLLLRLAPPRFVGAMVGVMTNRSTLRMFSRNVNTWLAGNGRVQNDGTIQANGFGFRGGAKAGGAGDGVCPVPAVDQAAPNGAGKGEGLVTGGATNGRGNLANGGGGG